MKTELLLSINAKATSNRLGTPHRATVWIVSLNPNMKKREDICYLFWCHVNILGLKHYHDLQFKKGNHSWQRALTLFILTYISTEI